MASLVWLDVARSLSSFSGAEDGFRSWLFTIARRRVLDHRRASARRPATEPLVADREPSAVGGDPAGAAEWEWSTDAALALLGTLKPIQAEVIALRVIVGLDVEQVAKLVHKSPGAVRVIAHRGLREWLPASRTRRGSWTGGCNARKRSGVLVVTMGLFRRPTTSTGLDGGTAERLLSGRVAPEDSATRLRAGGRPAPDRGRRRDRRRAGGSRGGDGAVPPRVPARQGAAPGGSARAGDRDRIRRPRGRCHVGCRRRGPARPGAASGPHRLRPRRCPSGRAGLLPHQPPPCLRIDIDVYQRRVHLGAWELPGAGPEPEHHRVLQAGGGACRDNYGALVCSVASDGRCLDNHGLAVCEVASNGACHGAAAGSAPGRPASPGRPATTTTTSSPGPPTSLPVHGNGHAVTTTTTVAPAPAPSTTSASHGNGGGPPSTKAHP